MWWPLLSRAELTGLRRIQLECDLSKENEMQSISRKTTEANGRQMAYVELGTGAPIVLLHGNPTSSYLWRNVIPYLQSMGRVVAPDLIGMGDSEKLGPGDEAYSLQQHQSYVDAFLAALKIESTVTLVMHDWGAPLGFDWARRHPDSVKSLIHMEGLVSGINSTELPAGPREFFEAVRSDAGEAMALIQNAFLERSLLKGTARSFTSEEVEEYRRPFLRPGEDRRPMLAWPRQIPIDGSPADVANVFLKNEEWLNSNAVPKLWLRADPGTYSPRLIERVRRWRNQDEVVVAGGHYPQEDSPEQVGEAIATWMLKVSEQP